MIDPSKINLSSLPWLPLDEKSAFPRNPAVYFAIDSQGVVQYIGRSVDPRNRWASHHKYEELKAMGDIKIVYLFVDFPESLPEIESSLISWFNPPLNIVKFATYALSEGVGIEDWENQFVQKNKKNKVPSASVIGAELAEEYRGRLLWVEEFKSWMEYSLDINGVWSFVSDTYATSAVYNIVCGKGIRHFRSMNYIANVMEIMQLELYSRHWNENRDLLPFTDGVLNLQSGEFSPHSPANRLTWCLPRAYSTPAISQTWDTIDNWMNEFTSNNAQDKEVLIHFAAALLRGRTDLQKFLHLIGSSSNGKSIYTSLLIQLVGQQNCWISSFDSLEDKHEVIRLLGKRLVLLIEEDKVNGRLNNFKRLIEQDLLTGQQLHSLAINFQFQGMAIVASNSPISQDMPDWLKQRILSIGANYKPRQFRDLATEFNLELSAFTRYLISIPNEQGEEVLTGLNQETDFKRWQSAIDSDSIAAWVNDWVIFEEGALTQIGGNKFEWEGRTYSPSQSTLFGSYALYCKQTGLIAKSKNNFSADLIDLCQKLLGREEIKYERCKSTGRRCINGLKLQLIVNTNFLTNGTAKELTSDFKRQSWLYKIENSTIALFMEEMLAPSSENNFTFVGIKNSNHETLYGAYVEFCNNNSKTLLNASKFKNHLLDLCREIGWDVREARQRDNEYRIYGVRLRSHKEVAPKISESFIEPTPVCKEYAGDAQTVEDLQNMECTD